MTALRRFVVLTGLVALCGCASLEKAWGPQPAPYTTFLAENARPPEDPARPWGPSVMARVKGGADASVAEETLVRLASAPASDGWRRPPWSAHRAALPANSTPAPEPARAASNPRDTRFTTLSPLPEARVTPDPAALRFSCADGAAITVALSAEGTRAEATPDDGPPVALARDRAGRGGLYSAPSALMRMDADGLTWIAGAESVEVRAGDSLWAIAERAYGAGARWNDIARANADRIADPNAIRPGQVLRLPTRERRCSRADTAESQSGVNGHADSL